METPDVRDDPSRLVAEVFRQEYGRVVAGLVRRFGDIELAEDVAQEAFVEAVRRWPESGPPPNPGAWLTTTARNRAIDRLRRESTRDARHAQAAMLDPQDDDIVDPDSVSSVPDDRLRLIFTCCHPALARDAQVALTLRLLGGLTTAEIARAFLVDEAAMAKRLTRSKQKIKAAHIPYRVPPDHELPSRLAGVLATLYLVFNEGYLPADVEVRTDLSAEAIRQARVLATLMPDEPEVLGLLALMLLTEARRPARFAGGSLVVLPEQDRTLWDSRLVAEGHALVRACLRRGRPGPYQIQAAINAVHTDAARAEDTDWGQVVALYDQLYAVTPTPVVALNRAVALAERDGAVAGLAALASVEGLDGYHPYQASRADLLRRAGRKTEAVEAYRTAVELSANPAERAYLAGRLAELTDAPG
ncbi:MAG TPA: sigma-70 family RNA polymerase sigma factor [Lapillicoccus sp.]|nr:sigma-70 family RNA polymerase sigma factor [Lapillicoccus sp.]